MPVTFLRPRNNEAEGFSRTINVESRKRNGQTLKESILSDSTLRSSKDLLTIAECLQCFSSYSRICLEFDTSLTHVLYSLLRGISLRRTPEKAFLEIQKTDILQHMAWLPQHIGSTEKARRVENQSLKQNKTKQNKTKQNRVLPGSPVVKTLPSNTGDVCSNRAW